MKDKQKENGNQQPRCERRGGAVGENLCDEKCGRDCRGAERLYNLRLYVAKSRPEK